VDVVDGIVFSALILLVMRQCAAKVQTRGAINVLSIITSVELYHHHL
jgi:hypothetical protein